MILRSVASQQVSALQDDRPDMAHPRDAALWADFAAPSSAVGFYRSWLAIQCGFVAHAVAGALMVDDGEGSYAVAARWPDDGRDASHLAAAVAPAVRERRGNVHYPPDNAGQMSCPCVAYPVEIDGQLRAVVVVQIAMSSPADLQLTVQRLHWGAGWLETLFRRFQSEDGEARIRRMTFAMDILNDA